MFVCYTKTMKQVCSTVVVLTAGLAMSAVALDVDSAWRLEAPRRPVVEQFIPEMKYEDAANLASGAKATAGSERPGDVAANVLDGYARTLKGGSSREWISDPVQGLPQAIRVDLVRVEEVGEVRIVFDSNFYVQPKWIKHVMPTTLAKSYLLEGSTDGKMWETLADVSENCRRMAVHRFARRRISTLRLTVRGTYGDASARVFEIRCYR